MQIPSIDDLVAQVLALPPEQQDELFAAVLRNRGLISTIGFERPPLPSGSVRQVSGLSEYGQEAGGSSSTGFTSQSGPRTRSSAEAQQRSLSNASISEGPQTDIGGKASDTPRRASTRQRRSKPEEIDVALEDDARKRRRSSAETESSMPESSGDQMGSDRRKAQVRAAQVAFRERREQQMSDLELKISELEGSLHTSNEEKQRLRAELDRLQTQIQ